MQQWLNRGQEVPAVADHRTALAHDGARDGTPPGPGTEQQVIVPRGSRLAGYVLGEPLAGDGVLIPQVGDAAVREDGWIDRARVPWRNGTQTTNTRSAGSGFLLKMLFCTQLAPARHVIQVGEKISTSRVWPSARLNSDLRVEMAFSEMTRLG